MFELVFNYNCEYSKHIVEYNRLSMLCIKIVLCIPEYRELLEVIFGWTSTNIHW